MGDEKQQILQMVADGVISAEDGVKLLEALEKGEQKRRESEQRTPHRLHRRIVAEGIGERLAEIGPMVRTAVCEAFAGVGDGDIEEIIEIETGPGVDYDEFKKPVELSDGTTVNIRNSGRSHGGELVLRGTKGKKIEVIEGNADVSTRESECFVRWKDGELVLGIPETAAALEISLRGASIVTENLKASVDLKSKGGSINLEGQEGTFCLKTMGGCIVIELDESWKTGSKASTMGGSITLALPSSLSADISASAVGGDIAISEGLGEVSMSRSHAGSKVRLQVGEDDEAPRIKLKTMGGSIEITEKD
jgi:DUF4097 and DUF4098 domain-containing protein YvlB